MASASIKHSSTTTNSEVVEACYTWTIQNISFVLKDTEPIRSTAFKSSDKTTWSWYCTIKQVNGLMEFSLTCWGGGGQVFNERRIPAEFKFLLLGPKGELTLSEPDFRIFNIFKTGSDVAFSVNSLSKSKLLEHIINPGDTLTTICRVRELLNQTCTNDKVPILPCRVRELLSKKSTAGSFPISPCKMKNDLETILKNSQFTDFTLVVEGRIIKAHKAILAARSSVFAAMFSVDMMENKQNQVTISDMEYEVAQQMLRFIYTGKTEDKPELADRLLAAADKYGLMRLKEMCEQTVSETIAVTTAIKTLILADRINADHLKSRTMKFIKANINKVMESDDWKTMVVEHPMLLREVCRALALE